ncbi:pyridoxal phosphate-dependent decarboxylase family protein [Aspergillus clavatus NRRL 1]|uniref:Pyridoxal-dependent decarboxylase conserved domain protein n=1 Tax=Aspergillus clavatus (strain ATCC 1007 / CBS 513.65 / DSM 816 / NCTC 3887 / NRRL 1 / QM 1276 / 107) TaxID=344612 RepID=A1C4M8_ASPCL|nr:pyridoxal-dependent decarboxylase conserved domain protein [Aspergillus clavatus NRRL 1]EAW15368.1 pyridoxal-dependent decarboxylase conserved domain protein [Aspergillus clavatus NRRL 1]
MDTKPNKCAVLSQLNDEINHIWPELQHLFYNLHVVSNSKIDEIIVRKEDEDKVLDIESLAVPTFPQPILHVIHQAWQIFDHRIRTNHPLFFGFAPSTAMELSWLGDSIVSAFNAHVGGRVAGSGPCAIENALIQWLASKVGFPLPAGGIFVSGGSVANLSAMVVARDHLLPYRDFSRGMIYASDQAHNSVSKAARILGFPKDILRIIPSDSSFRMHVATLKSMIIADRRKGMIPFLIFATFGTTHTGAIDPIADIAEVARDEGLWLHVDGAYGASAALLDTRPGLTDELQHAHSLSWDAHKWLFQTYGCGILLIKNISLLAASFAVCESGIINHAGRIFDKDCEFWDLGFELTRPSRAMRLWFTMRVLGTKRISQIIEYGLSAAEMVETMLRQFSNWAILSPASLAILCFRYQLVNRNEQQLNKINSEISKKLISDNVAGIFTIQLQGKIAMRMCCITTFRMPKEELGNLIISND